MLPPADVSPTAIEIRWMERERERWRAKEAAVTKPVRFSKILIGRGNPYRTDICTQAACKEPKFIFGDIEAWKESSGVLGRTFRMFSTFRYWILGSVLTEVWVWKEAEELGAQMETWTSEFQYWTDHIVSSRFAAIERGPFSAPSPFCRYSPRLSQCAASQFNWSRSKEVGIDWLNVSQSFCYLGLKLCSQSN